MTGKAHALTVAARFGAVRCGALIISATGKVALGAVAGLVFLAWRPAVTVVLILMLCQEVKPGAGFSGMTVFGSDLYFGAVGKIPITVILLVAGILAAHNTAAATNAPLGEDFGVIALRQGGLL